MDGVKQALGKRDASAEVTRDYSVDWGNYKTERSKLLCPINYM